MIFCSARAWKLFFLFPPCRWRLAFPSRGAGYKWTQSTVIARSSELLRSSVRTWFVNSGNPSHARLPKARASCSPTSCHEACPTLATLRRLAPAAYSSLRLSVQKSVRAKSAHGTLFQAGGIMRILQFRRIFLSGIRIAVTPVHQLTETHREQRVGLPR